MSGLGVIATAGLPAVHSPIFGEFALVQVYTVPGFVLVALGIAAIVSVMLMRPRLALAAGVLAFLVDGYVVWRIYRPSEACRTPAEAETIGCELATMTAPLWGCFFGAAASILLIAAALWLERHPERMPRPPSHMIADLEGEA